MIVWTSMVAGSSSCCAECRCWNDKAMGFAGGELRNELPGQTLNSVWRTSSCIRILKAPKGRLNVRTGSKEGKVVNPRLDHQCASQRTADSSSKVHFISVDRSNKYQLAMNIFSTGF